MLLHPVFVVIYGVAWYEFSQFCQYGGKQKRLWFLIACMVFFLCYLTFYVYAVIAKPQFLQRYRKDTVVEDNKVGKKIFHIVAIAVLIVCTAYFGNRVYRSAVHFNWKLSWFLNDLEKKLYVKLESDNFYENGIDGLLEDLDKKVTLPDKLYLSNNFSLQFDEEGKITSLSTFLYGKDDSGKTKSFLIDYNSKDSKDMIVYLDGYVKPSYSEDKLLSPLQKTIKAITLSKIKNDFKGTKGAILYFGTRSFGFNTDKIVYVDKKGNLKDATKANNELKGYFVSIYDPEEESGPMTKRYELVDRINQVEAELPVDRSNTSQEKYEVYDGECYVTKQVGYRLCAVDAAAGTRFYSLAKTSDGGQTWSFINESPFGKDGGAATGVMFVDEKIGFIGLSNATKADAKLYRTEDGGKTFKEVTYPAVKTTEAKNPFDFPNIPTKEDEKLVMRVGQGTDGDYHGGSKAVFESIDNGKSFHYVKEQQQ